MQELAAQIKAEIDEARTAKAKHATSGPVRETDRQNRDEKQDDEVVLTRTDRSGNVRPLPTREHDESSTRRKKEKVTMMYLIVYCIIILICRNRHSFLTWLDAS